jgi:hypothetical protein
LTITSGDLDFIKNFNETVDIRRGDSITTNNISVNPYHFTSHFTGDCLKFLGQVMNVLNEGNHNNSDIQSDYFDIGWYVDINIGKWNKPYQFNVA